MDNWYGCRGIGPCLANRELNPGVGADTPYQCVRISCIVRQICNGSSSFPCSLNYRREAEDHLRVPPRGADQDQDHQLHCRGDDAAAE